MGEWFYKHDGTLQCGQGAEIPLAVMRRDIEAIVGAANVTQAEKKMHPYLRSQLCGTPTGQTNRYYLEVAPTAAQLTKLEVAGFHPWPQPQAKVSALGGGGDVWPKGTREGVDILPWSARGGGDAWPWKTAEGKLLHAPLLTDNPNAPDVIGYLASVRSTPALIGDLLGFRCRVITPDNPYITLELLPNRVNIFVDEDGRITDIKFF